MHSIRVWFSRGRAVLSCGIDGSAALEMCNAFILHRSTQRSIFRLSAKEACAKRHPEMCLAIPGQILEILPERDNLALVDVVGVRRKIDIGLLADGCAQPGDWVLIHVGFAMSRISEEDAREQIRILRVMGEQAAALEEARGYGSDDAAAGDGP